MMSWSNASTRLMMMSCLGAALLVTGCGEGTLELEQTGIKEAGAESYTRQSELVYLMDAAEVFEAFEAGEALFVPKQAFYGVNIMATLDGSLEGVEYQFKDVNGVWSDWAPLEEIYHEDKFHNTTIEVRDGALEFKLRGGENLEFMRMEFAGELFEHEDHFHFDDDIADAEGPLDEALNEAQRIQMAISRPGRWVMPAAVKAAGQRQHVPYTSAPAWNGGRNCSGTFLPGSRELGQYLVNRFPGARYFQGYNCRQVRGASSMSVHGTGRAIDVFIPLHRGEADNDLGDPVANWLVENASNIGVQMIIWDRTTWSGNRSGEKDRYYSGQHPHHDHLHIELTPQGANRQTPWFRNRTDAPSSSGSTSSGSTSNASCTSQTLGRSIPHGQCVQMAYEKCGGRCKWSRCANGAWVCSNESACSTKHANAACAPAAAAAPAPAVTCHSSTLGRRVPAGSCVQMNYNGCGGTGTCQWATCTNAGGWQCVAQSACGSGQKFPHSSCSAQTTSGKACYSRTLGRNVPHGQSVQMAYAACGGGTCRWAVCNNGDWKCVASPQGTAHRHSSCR